MFETDKKRVRNVDFSELSREDKPTLTLEEQNKVVRDTYLTLAITMIPTIIGAGIGISMNLVAILASSPLMFTVTFLVLVYGLMYFVNKNRYSAAGIGWLMLFTLVMGAFLAPLLQVALSFTNGFELITLAIGGTSVIFFSMAAIGTVTKKDLGFLNKFILVGLITVLAMIVINLFLQASFVSLAISSIFMIISSLMIMVQVNSLVKGGENSYIAATLTLYVAIYNIFSSLLHLLLAFAGQRE